MCSISYDTLNLTTIPAEAKTMFASAWEHNNSVSLFKSAIRCTDIRCTLIPALTTEVMYTYLIISYLLVYLCIKLNVSEKGCVRKVWRGRPFFKVPFTVLIVMVHMLTFFFLWRNVCFPLSPCLMKLSVRLDH